jgi:hypothetical protein
MENEQIKQDILLICLDIKKFLQGEYIKTAEQLRKFREENNG